MTGDGSSTSTGPRLIKRAPMTAEPELTGMGSRWIFPPQPQGWTEFVLSEWELRSAGWADLHPHTETNVVVEGELHVECAGETVVAGAGDTVTVPAGVRGRYWAPDYARMIAVYGPNPDAQSTETGEYWEI